MKYYMQGVSVEDFNMISDFISKNKLDEVISIEYDEMFGTYFADRDENWGGKIPFEEGIEIIVADISYTGVYYAYTKKDYRDKMLAFIEKYSIDTNKKEYVKKINKMLDKQD